MGFDNAMEFDKQDKIRSDRKGKQKDEEFTGLFLELILLFSGEGDDPN